MCATRRFMVLGLGVIGFGLLGACSTGAGSHGSATGTPAEPEKLEYADEVVPNADLGLLWKAAHDYVAHHFELDVDDPKKRVVETETIAFEAEGVPYRARITVQVIPDPERENTARLGVLTRIMQPDYNLEEAGPGKPLYTRWRVVGTHKEMQDFVAGRILERYLLLRQGRDPDRYMSKSPFEGPIRKANN